MQFAISVTAVSFPVECWYFVQHYKQIVIYFYYLKCTFKNCGLHKYFLSQNLRFLEWVSFQKLFFKNKYKTILSFSKIEHHQVNKNYDYSNTFTLGIRVFFDNFSRLNLKKIFFSLPTHGRGAHCKNFWWSVLILKSKFLSDSKVLVN